MDYNNPALTAAAQFFAGRNAVGKALELVRDFVIRANCGDDAEARLSIVVEELVANLVEHGDAPADSEIRLEVSALGADVFVKLSDAGTPFDPRLAELPGEIPERGGGAGLALVRHWAREIGYVSADGRNVLTLIISNDV